MQKDSISAFTVEERLVIYRTARDHYFIHHRSKKLERMFGIVGNACSGMCKAMEDALTILNLRRKSCFTRYNFPEYFSYEPSHCWKGTAYWWTPSIKNGGFKRRMTILDRLAEGLSKGE
jgi:hypothetical protein